MRNIVDALAVLSVLAVIVAFVGCSSDTKNNSLSSAPDGELSDEELQAELELQQSQQSDDQTEGVLLTGSAIADVTGAVTLVSCQDEAADANNPDVKGTTTYTYKLQDKKSSMSASVIDRCYNASILIEYFCAGNRSSGRRVTCSNGCNNGACLAANTSSIICGDGRREGAEQCDDGNTQPYDGCEPTTCTRSTRERRCVVNPPSHNDNVDVHYSFGRIGTCDIAHGSGCFYRDYTPTCSPSDNARISYTCNAMNNPTPGLLEACSDGTVCRGGECVAP